MIQGENHLFQILNSLGVIFESKSNSKGWIPILCYSHNDKELGNAFINNESGITKCFACGASYNLFTLVKIFKKEYSYSDYLKLLGYSEDYIEEITSKRKNELKKNIKLNKEQKYYFDFSNLKTARFRFDDFEYTKLRGFTKEFISSFDIRLIVEGYYKNYIAIPIVDKKLDIYSIEFRKVGENEKSTKVLYPKNINVKETIFNRENLKLNNDLYIKEGVSGIPKIWSNITRNITSIFGVSESQYQIDILDKFNGKKIFICDNDDSSTDCIYYLSKRLKDFYVISSEHDDTDDNFLDDIRKKEIIPGIEYVINYYGLMDWVIR